jgi:hypothetical protein
MLRSPAIGTKLRCMHTYPLSSASEPATPPSKTAAFTGAVRCTNAQDLVAAAPYLLGFTVTNSLVVLLLQNGRSSGAFRIALPKTPQRTVDATAEIASTVADMVRNLASVEAVALLLYTSGEITDPATPPGAPVLYACKDELERIPKHTAQALCVTSTSWVSITDRATSPWGGHPVQAAEQSAVAFECSARIGAPIRALEDSARLGTVSDQLKRDVTRSCARVSERPRERITPGHPFDDASHVVSMITDLLDSGVHLKPTKLAKIIGALQREEHWVNAAVTFAVGQKAWQTMCQGCWDLHGVTIREFLMRTPRLNLFDPPTRQRVLGVILSELGSEHPDFSRLNAAQRSLASLSAAAPVRLRPSLEALRSYSWWLAGMPSVATSITSRYLSHAHPGSRLCFIHALATMLEQHPHPAWIRWAPDHRSEHRSA